MGHKEERSGVSNFGKYPAVEIEKMITFAQVTENVRMPNHWDG